MAYFLSLMNFPYPKLGGGGEFYPLHFTITKLVVEFTSEH
jgi:hypothetical protein